MQFWSRKTTLQNASMKNYKGFFHIHFYGCFFPYFLTSHWILPITVYRYVHKLPFKKRTYTKNIYNITITSPQYFILSIKYLQNWCPSHSSAVFCLIYLHNTFKRNTVGISVKAQLCIQTCHLNTSFWFIVLHSWYFFLSLSVGLRCGNVVL